MFRAFVPLALVLALLPAPAHAADGVEETIFEGTITFGGAGAGGHNTHVALAREYRDVRIEVECDAAVGFALVNVQPEPLVRGVEATCVPTGALGSAEDLALTGASPFLPAGDYALVFDAAGMGAATVRVTGVPS